VEGISPLTPLNEVPLLLLLSLAFSAEPSPRNALLQDARRSGEFLVVLGAPNPETGERMKAAAEGLRLRRGGGITFLEATDATEADYARPLVVLAGTIRSNPWIARVASALPLSVSSNGIQLRETLYADPRDSLQLVYPSPFPEGKLVYLFTGNSDEAVLDALTAERRGDFQIRRAGTAVVLGRFETTEPDPRKFASSRSRGDTRRLRPQGGRNECASRRTLRSGLLPEIASIPASSTRARDQRHASGPFRRCPATRFPPRAPSERLLVERWLESRFPIHA
jgi:hypothetical protein